MPKCLLKCITAIDLDDKSTSLLPLVPNLQEVTLCCQKRDSFSDFEALKMIVNLKVFNLSSWSLATLESICQLLKESSSLETIILTPGFEIRRQTTGGTNEYDYNFHYLFKSNCMSTRIWLQLHFLVAHFNPLLPTFHS